MLYRRLGKSGLKLSALSYGSWVTFKNQLDQKQAERMMSLAYDAGVNFFDNAEVYANGESERIMGEALQNLAWRRDSFTVSSKVFWGGDKPTQQGLSRKHIFDACHAALRRLKVDYLDLYFCHRPDPETPIEETVVAMNDLQRQGKILYWGTSEWSAEEITEAFLIAKELRLQGPSMEQPEYNLFHRQKMEKDFLPLFEKFGLGTTIWSPLASGQLTGKYLQEIPAGARASLPQFQWLREKILSPEGRARQTKVAALQKVAETLECSLPQLALAWCLKNPAVSTVILGATSETQLKQNLDSLAVLDRLNSKVLAQIETFVEEPESPKAQKGLLWPN